MSQYLKEFYKAYKEYLKGGHNVWGFTPSQGLCGALQAFCNRAKYRDGTCFNLKQEMVQQFVNAKLCPSIPFNNCMSEWAAEHRSGRMIYNFRRIQWVMDHAA